MWKYISRYIPIFYTLILTNKIESIFHKEFFLDSAPKFWYSSKMLVADEDEFESEASGIISLKKFPRSKSMPYVNPKSSMPYINPPHKLRLVQQDSIQSNGSLFNKDSGIVDENHSGISVGVIPEGLAEVVQGDFPSGGSGMLASEPQSEVEVAEHQILGEYLKFKLVLNYFFSLAYLSYFIFIKFYC